MVAFKGASKNNEKLEIVDRNLKLTDYTCSM